MSSTAAVFKLSSLHLVEVVNAELLLQAVHGDCDRQPDGRLGGRQREDEEDENLATARADGAVIGEGHQRDIDRVEHQLDAHDDQDDVASRQNSPGADEEQHHGEYQVLMQGRHQCVSRLASRTAPTTATSSTSETSSKGNV